MGEIADQIGELTVEAASPDGRITARVEGMGRVRLTFGAGAYARYDDASLAHQLARLATLSWAKRQRHVDEILEHHLGATAADIPVTGDARSEYVARIGRLVSTATSTDGSIDIATRSMAQWKIDIRTGTLRRLTQEQFGVQLLGAFAQVARKHQRQVLLVKDEIYGFGFPSDLRQLMGLPNR